MKRITLDLSQVNLTTTDLMLAFEQAARAAGWKKATIDTILTEFYAKEPLRLAEHLGICCERFNALAS